MLKRRFGRTDFEVSVIGLGGIPIQHRNWQEALSVIRRAIGMGINYIDTARDYQDSEDKIGAAIKECGDRVFLSTKNSIVSLQECYYKRIRLTSI